MTVAYSDAEIEAMFDGAPEAEVIPLKPERRSTWNPVDLVSAALSPPAPPSIEGIVYPGRRHVFSGEPESLKSWALFCLYVAEMRKGNTVMHIDLEMGRHEIFERLTQLGATSEDIGGRFILLEPQEPMTGEGTLPLVRSMLSRRKPTLVGVDAFTGALLLHKCDPNSGVEIERFFRTVLDELRAFGAAVVVLDHLSKSKDSRGKYAIGSERKIGAADSHLSFQMVKTFGRGEHGKAEITVQKDRPGHLQRKQAIILDLFSSPDTGAIKFVWHFEKRIARMSGNFRPTAYMERVSSFVASCLEPPSAAEAEERAGGKSEWAHAAVEILVRDGFLRRGKNQFNEPTLLMVKPYAEMSDPASDKFVAAAANGNGASAPMAGEETFPW